MDTISSRFSRSNVILLTLFALSVVSAALALSGGWEKSDQVEKATPVSSQEIR